MEAQEMLRLVKLVMINCVWLKIYEKNSGGKSPKARTKREVFWIFQKRIFSNIFNGTLPQRP
jgi:hypothetical protein